MGNSFPAARLTTPSRGVLLGKGSFFSGVPGPGLACRARGSSRQPRNGGPAACLDGESPLFVEDVAAPVKAAVLENGKFPFLVQLVAENRDVGPQVRPHPQAALQGRQVVFAVEVDVEVRPGRIGPQAGLAA